MRFVRIDELKPNMISVKSLYHKDKLLLAANKKLTTSLIKQLKKNKISGIYVFDEFSEYEELKDIISDEKRHELVNALQSLSIDKVIFLANDIVDKMMKEDEILLDMNTIQNYHQNTYEHSVNVCMLAIACGIGMGLNNKELNELAIGSLFHDIGKTAISKDILDKPGRLTPEERAIINTHPELGYNMLYDNTLINASSRAGVLCHHENEDGSGYPNKLKGLKIPLVAKIIHVADVYDALCSKRAYKEKYDAKESIEYLMGNCGIMFNFDVVETFIKYVVVYPVGTTVKLSTGEEARVVKNRAENVLRPVVVTLKDKKKIDLMLPEFYNITILEN